MNESRIDGEIWGFFGGASIDSSRDFCNTSHHPTTIGRPPLGESLKREGERADETSICAPCVGHNYFEATAAGCVAGVCFVRGVIDFNGFGFLVCRIGKRSRHGKAYCMNGYKYVRGVGDGDMSH